jgi:hypothetical protein
MCEVYRIFSKDWEHLFDYSEDSMRELNLYESHGLGECKPNNGFYWGKKYMDVTVKMWREDIRDGILLKYELYEDEKYPNWWLDKVLKGK